jgi:hypothetical protein
VSRPHPVVRHRTTGCAMLHGMTTPADPETPQPRDIALEQETPELADDLDRQSDPDPADATDVS